MRAKKPYDKKRKRVGRGIGSGHGKRSTRGQKGQRSRSGYRQRAGFEGGQNPFYRRMPKRGFNNAAFKIVYDVVNISQLDKLGVKDVTLEILAAKRLISGGQKVKVLGSGDIKKAMTVNAHAFSGSAKEKIEKCGGKTVVIS